MIKTQENFDTYSVLNLYIILKEHESEVKEIAEEKIKMNFGGPMAFVSKTIGKYNGSNDEDEENEEGFLLKSNDKAIAYYSNYKVKKF